MALAHAILAALDDQSCSGYDLAKQFDRSIGFFWKATFQQIYRELGKLEEQGWVQGEVIPQVGRPTKKQYSVTEQGRAQLARWVAEPCDLETLRADLLVKLFAGSLAPMPVMVQELERHRQLHQEQLLAYEAIAHHFFPQPETLAIAPLFRYLTLRKGIRYEMDAIAWCEEAIEWLNAASQNTKAHD